MAGDANDRLDEGLPLGSGQGIGDREDLDGSIFLAGSTRVARGCGVDRRAARRDGAAGPEPMGLVALYLDQDMVAGVTGEFECFFDSAWRRA